MVRSLRQKADAEGLRSRQLYVFDRPDRDDRGWVLSVARVEIVPSGRLPVSDARQLVALDSLPTLKYYHREIVAYSFDSVRADYLDARDPAGLFEARFTMRELRRLYEAVLGRVLLPDTFRRAMLPGLHATGATRVEGRGWPAELFEQI